MFPEKVFSFEVRKRLSDFMLAVFQRSPDCIALLKVVLVQRTFQIAVSLLLFTFIGDDIAAVRPHLSALVTVEEVVIEQEQIDSKNGTPPFPVLYVEGGIVILGFSEIFGDKEPIKKARKDHHRHPTNKVCNSVIRENITSTNNQSFEKSYHPELLRIDSPPGRSKLYSSDPNNVNGTTEVCKGGALKRFSKLFLLNQELLEPHGWTISSGIQVMTSQSQS